MAKGGDLEEGVIDFAVRIIRLCVALPKEPVVRYIRDCTDVAATQMTATAE